MHGEADRRAARRACQFAAMLAIGAAGPARGAITEEFHGVRSTAMGGAHRGVGSSNDTLWLNPAAMSMFTRYSVEMDYGFASFDDLQTLTLSAVDSKSGPVAGGASYSYSWGEDNPASPVLHRTVMALSYALVPRLLSLGLSARNVRGSVKTPDDSRDKFSVYNGDVGVAIHLDPGIGIGLSAHNLLDSKEPAWTPRSYAAGIAYDVTPVTLAADLEINARPGERSVTSYHVGAEYFASQEFPLRIGYRRVPFVRPNGTDALDDQITAGAGWVSPGGALALAYQRSINRPKQWTIIGAINFYL